LESQKGYCVTDQDYWIHQFKTFRGRDFQLIMMVEIKTMGASLSMAQRDTLHIINQITRNRKQTPTKDLKYQAGLCPISKVFSCASDKKVYLRSYGAHVLTFSGLGPDDSECIKWDTTKIDHEILTNILRFDLDPDTLNHIDLRYHHIARIDRQPTLF